MEIKAATPGPESTPSFPSAADSDPVKLGWMQGHPPPPDKLVRFADMTHYRFPQMRWSFANFRQLTPTSNIARGDWPVSVLPKAERKEIDALAFTPMARTDSMTWAQSLAANYTDAIVILHKGQIVYERYMGVMTPSQHHIAFSVTKSVFGTLAAMLVDEGKLDERALVTSLIPELKNTAYEGATVRHVMDMTIGVQYSENYADPQAEIWAHARAGGVMPRPAGYSGPDSFYAFLQTLKKDGEHGTGFYYKTVNSDVLGWLIRRATGQGVGAVLSECIWRRMGAEHDGYMLIDSTGTEFAGGGFNCTLRDLARFGEVLRLDGFYNDQQIISKAVVADIRKGASKTDYETCGLTATTKGWSYRNMWWVTHNEHGAYSARGIHGQAIYIDPMAQMVIARFGSHPLAGNFNFDPTSLPAFHAVAKHLMGE
ncbi:MAG: serine hydrolase domain-containing protein [Rhodoferax sp.]